MAYFSSVVNNPRQSWAEYLGLPEDLDEYTLDEVRSSVSSYVMPAANDAAATPAVAAQERVITIGDFADYMRRVGEPYAFLAANRPQTLDDGSDDGDGDGDGPSASIAASDAERAEQLKHVPELCFQEDFDLSRPETFAYFSPPDQPHASMVTLEKLNGHLDTVELTLLAEVSSRHDGFFEVLSSYEKLRGEVAAGCAQIEQLRTKMRALEANLVDKSLRLPVLVRRRANTAALLEKLRLVHAVWATQPTIQQLLTARDFPGALDLISSSQQLLSTELSGVHALKKLGLSLTTTKRQITHMMSKDLLQLALGYDLDGEAPAAPREALASELEGRFVPLGSGLLRLRLLVEALGELEDHLMKEVRSLVKRQLQEELTAIAQKKQSAAAAEAEADVNGSNAGAPSADGEAAGGAPSSSSAAEAAEAATTRAAPPVTKQLQKLSTEGFEEVMAAVVTPLMVILRRAAAIHNAVLKTLASPAGKAAAAAAAGSEADEGKEYVAQVEARSADLLLHTCELAQERYMRLLNKRKEVHSRLRLVDFVRMTKSVNEFVRDVAHLCPKAHSALAAELQQHSTEFLRVTHEAAKGQLTAIVESEQWKQVEVAPEFQQIADAFSRNQVPTLAESELLRLREQTPLDASAAATPRELLIDGTGYKVVGSSLMLLSNCAYYMQCVSTLQTVGAQVAQLLPALLKLFHEITYKQVLHGGAMRTDAAAGLKVITAKHLALASQALGLVLSLLPHLKAILAAYVPESQRALLKGADEAATDYASHQDQLSSKFVAMLEDRRKGHVAALAQQLTPSAERRRPEPTESVKLVIKDLLHMHKVLQPLLARTQLHTVFERLLGTFDEGLLLAYKAADTTVLFTRQCIVADVLHLKQEVGKLHLALPNGVCPELVAFAKSLNVA